MTLEEIFFKNNCKGKTSFVHDYAEKYDQFLVPYKDKSINLLELGIANGDSLRSWTDYFPEGKIYGLDVIDCSKDNSSRIQTFKGSQSDNALLKSIVEKTGDLDVIIDDGSHIVEHWISSFEYLFPHVKDGGLYIIEDLHCDWDLQRRINPSFPHIWEYFSALMKDIQFNGRNKNGEFYGNKNIHAQQVLPLSYNEQHIHGIHLYNSIIFIEKKNCLNKEK